LWGGIGRGKTTVLRELHKQVGGAFLNMKDFVEASAGKHPLALEETLYQLIVDALKAHPLVIVDDVHLLDLFSAGCHFYPRSGYFNSIMMGLCTYALEAKKNSSSAQNLTSLKPPRNAAIPSALTVSKPRITPRS
jgi:hypothetical protein